MEADAQTEPTFLITLLASLASYQISQIKDWCSYFFQPELLFYLCGMLEQFIQFL